MRSLECRSCGGFNGHLDALIVIGAMLMAAVATLARPCRMPSGRSAPGVRLASSVRCQLLRPDRPRRPESVCLRLLVPGGRVRSWDRRREPASDRRRWARGGRPGGSSRGEASASRRDSIDRRSAGRSTSTSIAMAARASAADPNASRGHHTTRAGAPESSASTRSRRSVRGSALIMSRTARSMAASRCESSR
jgi:hypothetical protein